MSSVSPAHAIDFVSPEQPTQRKTQLALAAQKRRGLNVLVVDDDHDDVELICSVLRLHLAVADYRCAWDGEEALKLLETGDYRPDIIILDLNMPRLGGLEVLPRVRGLESCAGASVVVLTTSGRASDVHDAVRGSADGYIIKPDTARELQERLDSVIDSVVHGKDKPERTR